MAPNFHQRCDIHGRLDHYYLSKKIDVPYDTTTDTWSSHASPNIGPKQVWDGEKANWMYDYEAYTTQRAIERAAGYDAPHRLTDFTIRMLNANTYYESTGLVRLPAHFRRLLDQTYAFADKVLQLARLQVPFADVALLLVDFSINVLQAHNSIFGVLLLSQRARIYWILDDTLLQISLDEWEKPEGCEATPNLPWSQTVGATVLQLSKGSALLPEWAEQDESQRTGLNDLLSHNKPAEGKVLKQLYFRQSRRFFEDSLRQYWVRWKVNASLKGRLPVELADMILDDVAESDKVYMGPLRTKHISKGKGKVE